ncbi:putative F-box protein PP2-B12 [Corylus avellana]|uniref:putative F-box protein PP2-B12 n=1 Tax=Corylus avellana TaxID=13451 RepID=UPI001E2367C2|nr:putative F-box protein PP2-B12 [Corylus avellana]
MATENEAVDLIYALPEECIASVLSFTSPPDACRSLSVSTNFRLAAESDAVWESFLPPQYKSIISRSAESSALCISSKKELYLRLCDHPLLIDEGRKSFWLEKRSGKICYMLSPKDLQIVWMGTPRHWTWTSLPDARFPEVAELISVCWLEIRGKINTGMLSPTTLYTAHLVFKATTGSFGFENQPVEVEVGVVGSAGGHKRSVFLDAERGRRLRHQIVRRRGRRFTRSGILCQPCRPRVKEEDGECPKERGDGWLEMELGEFFNGGEDDDDGEVEMSVLEVKGGNWKGGLIVQGIEIRPKRG